MAGNYRQTANDGYAILQKGWSAQSSNAKQTVGSGGRSTPTGGSAVTQTPGGSASSNKK